MKFACIFRRYFYFSYLQIKNLARQIFCPSLPSFAPKKSNVDFFLQVKRKEKPCNGARPKLTTSRLKTLQDFLQHSKWASTNVSIVSISWNPLRPCRNTKQSENIFGFLLRLIAGSGIVTVIKLAFTKDRMGYCKSGRVEIRKSCVSCRQRKYNG